MRNRSVRHLLSGQWTCFTVIVLTGREKSEARPLQCRNSAKLNNPAPSASSMAGTDTFPFPSCYELLELYSSGPAQASHHMRCS